MSSNKKNEKLKYILTICLTAAIVFLITAWLYTFYFTHNDNGVEKIIVNQSETISKLNLEEKINLVKNILKSKYLGNLDENSMVEGAIKGYVEGLGDQYTEYLTEKEYETLTTTIDGNYVGIGVYITQTKNKEIYILAPIEGSPAEEAGIQSGDIVLTANGEELTGLNSDVAVNKIKGPEGTTVDLQILRNDETIEMTVERRKITLKYIDSEMLENNIGYIQMLSFDENCTKNFMEHYNKLKEQGMKSLIIDIRDNGGGLVNEATSLIDKFVEKDTCMMQTIDKNGDQKNTLAGEKSTISNINIILLVNENSASASEILAGALQDCEVATLVGETTYGKGVMQELIPFGKGAIKVTIEEFRTPNGNVINEVGIVPNVEIEDDKNTEEDEQLQKAIEILNNK